MQEHVRVNHLFLGPSSGHNWPHHRGGDMASWCPQTLAALAACPSSQNCSFHILPGHFWTRIPQVGGLGWRACAHVALPGVAAQPSTGASPHIPTSSVTEPVNADSPEDCGLALRSVPNKKLYFRVIFILSHSKQG